MGCGTWKNSELVFLSMGQAGWKGVGGSSQFPGSGVPQRKDMKHVSMCSLSLLYSHPPGQTHFGPFRYVYQSHFQELINSYPNPVTFYTDGSKLKSRTGFAYSIDGDGSINPHSGTAGYLPMPQIHPLPSYPITLPALFARIPCLPSTSSPPLFQRIPILLATLPNKNITFIWIPGHRGIYWETRISTKPFSRAFVHSSFRPELFSFSTSENQSLPALDGLLEKPEEQQSRLP